ncbi:MAG: CDP-diacylglycerol--glycerol-3-phosphate 3-phosphatidyltransferase [Acidimicrobiales bacterium]|nr:CDP-diacylglycerol--glycerol-3-phosphate 3-phosphatidyltransferase [Acidimicrobiales bacterium]
MNAVLHHTGAFVTNAANMLTLARIAAAPVLFSLVLSHEATLGASWAAALLGLAMAVTDKIDGMLARSRGGTRAGAFLDPLADKVVVLGGMACLYIVGSYALIPVVIVWIRELAVSLWRFKWAGRGVAIPARNSAKYKTFVQGLALLFAITPGVVDERWLVQSSLWLAVALTVFTGVQYLFDGRTHLPRHPA